MATIKVPKNLGLLADRLPAPDYKNIIKIRFKETQIIFSLKAVKIGKKG